MNKLTLAFVAAFALAGCAHHGAHTSASAEKDCCAMKKGEAMKGGEECKHDVKSADGKDACEHEKTEAAAATASPTPATH